MNFDLNVSFISIAEFGCLVDSFMLRVLNSNQSNARFAPERGEEYAKTKFVDLQHKLLGFRVSFQSFE